MARTDGKSCSIVSGYWTEDKGTDLLTASLGVNIVLRIYSEELGLRACGYFCT